MRHWLTIGLLTVAAPLVVAQESRPWVPRPFELAPFDGMQTTVIGSAGQESRAIAIGNGRTALGIYVYDPQGHCVALDDEPIGKVYDDRIASWVAAANGPYDVHIRNFGPGFNRLEASAK